MKPEPWGVYPNCRSRPWRTSIRTPGSTVTPNRFIRPVHPTGSSDEAKDHPSDPGEAEDHDPDQSRSPSGGGSSPARGVVEPVAASRAGVREIVNLVPAPRAGSGLAAESRQIFGVGPLRIEFLPVIVGVRHSGILSRRSSASLASRPVRVWGRPNRAHDGGGSQGPRSERDHRSEQGHRPKDLGSGGRAAGGSGLQASND